MNWTPLSLYREFHPATKVLQVAQFSLVPTSSEKKTSGIQHLHGFWMILVDFNGFWMRKRYGKIRNSVFFPNIEGVWHRFSFEWCISVRFEVRRGAVRGTNFAPKKLRTFHQQGTPAGYWPSLNHCCQHQHRFGDNFFFSSCGKPKN